MILIGYGTGRCGTKSLASFLNQQEGFNVTHESVGLAWYPILSDTESALDEFVSRKGDVVGDVAFYWIHYVGLMIRKYENVKAINIYRDDDEVVDSFWNYKANIRTYKSFMENTWFPYPYDSYEPTEEAIYRTIKQYRMMERELACYFPGRILRMNVEKLNDKESLSSLLAWLGCKDGKLDTFHENKRELIPPGNAHTERLYTFRRS